jgi:uncharacterized membrane protein
LRLREAGFWDVSIRFAMILALLLRLHRSCFNLQKPEVIRLPLPNASAQAQARKYTHGRAFRPLSRCLKTNLMEASNRSPIVAWANDIKDKKMKLATMALAAAFALSSTFALANTVRHKSNVTGGTSRVYQLSNNGNPNGTAAGPTTLSGTGSSQFRGSSPGTSGYN